MSRDDAATGSFSGAASGDLPVEQALALNEACDAFEVKWRAGGKPDVLAAVLELPEPVRLAALRELVQLDVYYRRQYGPAPTASEYAERFPELSASWLNSVVSEEGFDPNALTATGAGAPTAEVVPVVAGERFAAYVLLGEIARGAMGVVYKAQQLALDRVVAVKMIRSGEFADPAEVRRFRQEAEAAATLDHPNIVSVFEVGEFRGLHYYAMRLVEGGSLAVRMADWTVAGAASRGQAKQRQAKVVELMAAVARAVNHAHQRFILHRDLKPGNILLDAAGAPHVTDFGLARRIGKDSTLTRTGAILGTPAYMAPEQARGREDVTTEADVYGLGAVLYELLAGRPPFTGEDVLDTLYQVREREPIGPRAVCAWVDRDLETICLKCLEKNPDKRYAGAAALADDLERWSNGEPILARRAGALERAVKWLRRNPAGAGLVALGAVAAAAIIWGLVALSYNAELVEGKERLELANTNLRAEKEQADRLRKDAEEQQVVAEQQRRIADEQRRRAADQEGLARRYLYVTQMNQAQKAYEEKNPGLALALLDKVRPERPDQDDLRGPEWHHLWRLCGGSHIDLRGHDAAITCASFSTDGLLLASGDSRGVVKVWDVERQRERRTLTGSTAGLNAVAFDAKGNRLAAAGDDGVVRVWDVGTGRETCRFSGHDEPVLSVAFDPAGDRVVSGGARGTVTLWDTETGSRVREFSKVKDPVRSVAFARLGKVVLAAYDRSRPTAAEKTDVCMWVTESGELLSAWAAPPPAATFASVGRITCVRLSPCEGTALVAWWLPGKGKDAAVAQIEIQNVETNKRVRGWPVGPEAVTRAGFGLNGDIAVSTPTGGVTILGAEEETKQFRDPSTNTACVSPNGRILVTAGEDKVIRLRHLRDEVALPGGRESVAFSRDGGTVVAMGGRAAWDPRTGHELAPVTHKWQAPTTASSGARLGISPDGKWVSDGRDLVELRGGKSVALPEAQNQFGAAFSPDGLTVAGAHGHLAGATLHDLDGRLLASITKPPLSDGRAARETGFRSVCAGFSPDGRTLAIGFCNRENASDAGGVELWDMATRQLRHVLRLRYYGVHDVVFSPNGQYVGAACGNYASGSAATWEGGEVRLWDVAHGREVAVLGGYSACVWSLSFSPDGTRLATASGKQKRPTDPGSGRVRVWDLRAGQEVVSVVHETTVYGVAYSPDGLRLGVVGESKTGRIWGPP